VVDGRGERDARAEAEARARALAQRDVEELHGRVVVVHDERWLGAPRPGRRERDGVVNRAADALPRRVRPQRVGRVRGVRGEVQLCVLAACGEDNDIRVGECVCGEAVGIPLELDEGARGLCEARMSGGGSGEVITYLGRGEVVLDDLFVRDVVNEPGPARACEQVA
jgi:hypothetical protein